MTPEPTACRKHSTPRNYLLPMIFVEIATERERLPLLPGACLVLRCEIKIVFFFSLANTDSLAESLILHVTTEHPNQHRFQIMTLITSATDHTIDSASIIVISYLTYSYRQPTTTLTPHQLSFTNSFETEKNSVLFEKTSST